MAGRRGIYPRPTLAERFWARVDTSGGLFACWPWLGGRTPGGYGQMWRDGTTVRVSHVALELAGRPLSPGLEALHSCDNPPCANPAHLSEGTHAINIAERDANGVSQQTISGIVLGKSWVA